MAIKEFAILTMYVPANDGFIFVTSRINNSYATMLHDYQEFRNHGLKLANA